MGEVYKMTIAGCERELPICPISDTLDIAGFVMFVDVEITEKTAKALMEKCPEHDIIITAESKGIPLAYNKDMQEDKEAIFDAVDNVKLCVKTFTPMLATMRVLKDNMRNAAAKGFINATDCADYLVKKGLPFRDAYKITGTLVAECIQKNTVLEELPLEDYRAMTELFDEDVYDAISLDTCVRERKSEGGPSPEAVSVQISLAESELRNR